MPKVPEYPDLFTYRKTSVLSEDVQRCARDLGVAFHRTAVSAELVLAFRNSLRSLPAESVPRGAFEIREVAQMGYREPIELGSSSLQALGFKHTTICSLLEEYPDLSWLLMFHGNGYVRQAAMEALTTAPNCPFEVTAVVYRLNDWVDNVRLASMTYARTFLATASADAVSESTFFLLPQMTHLNRWDDQALSIVEESIYRPEVLNKLKEQFLKPRRGKVVQSLRLVLRRVDFDIYLEQLALDASLPTVRALVIETILTGRARWFVRYRREWIDKVYGTTRRIAEFETRNVDTDFSLKDVLQIAARDRSSLVRRIAADFLIEKRKQLTPEMVNLFESLSNDKSAAVRSRIDFLSRQMANV